MPELDYDLVAIGGGTAGLVSAAGARYIGARSAIVERNALGGDCLWTGCVPSKALLASARLAHAMRHADELGLQGSSPAHAFHRVMERMRDARDTVAHHDDPERFRSMGVHVHLGEGRFVDPHSLDVEGVGRIHASRFVVATGARPAVPPIAGLDDGEFLTYETAFEQDELPASLVLLGAGPIGMEFAQVYARLGARVTVVESGDQVLRKEEPEAAALLQGLLEGEGVTFELGSRASRIDWKDGGGGVTVTTEDGRRMDGDALFVATGRRPAGDGLELARAGVEVERGAVQVDETLQTANSHIWAAGDVTGGPQFTHMADYMAKKVVRNALVPFSSRVDYSIVPRVTYTDPEVAHVGLTKEEAEGRGGSVYRYEMSELDRAVCDGSTEGFVRIYADGKGRVLGATIVAHGAGEMLLPLILAMKHGLTLNDVTDTIFPYPTLSEGVLRTAQAYGRSRLESVGGRILRKVVSWLA
jgi:pyruvate/2-oxoglutarate dehydrogenase complex dihydrolipoamide dehydrogenase (E3) component